MVRDLEFIYCPWHQWGFELATGTTAVKPEWSIRTYPGPGRRQRCVGDGVTLEEKAVATMEINGGNVVYEILGESGDYIALTPGGRYSKDIEGLRPLAEELVKGGYRVLLWDRPNCGSPMFSSTGRASPTCGPRRCMR